MFAARGGFGGSTEESWQQDLDTEQRERIQEKEKKKAEDIWAGQFLQKFFFWLGVCVFTFLLLFIDY